jgi:hypothetical protein
MTLQTNTREVVIDDQAIICRELTVMQIRQWLQDTGQPTNLDVVSEALFRDCSLADLKRMTDLSDDVIDRLKPSQVQKVIDVCKELNPHFFALLSRLVGAIHGAASPT